MDRKLGMGLSSFGLGAANYINTAGPSMPSNGEEWISFAISALWAVLGVFMGRK